MIGRRSLLALPPALLLARAAGAEAIGPLHWDSGYLFLRVRVNGRAADALLDLNAPENLLDKRHATPLGVEDWHQRPVVEAAGQRMTGLAFAPSDLTDIANYKLHGRIALLLGSPFFATNPFLLDLANMSLSPMARRGARPGRKLPVTLRFGYPTVPATIDGVPAAAALSFRDADPLILRAGFVTGAGLARRRGDGAAVTRQLRTIGRVEIAGRTFTNIEAAVTAAPHVPDAWLGPQILRNFRIAIDMPAGMAWFDPV